MLLIERGFLISSWYIITINGRMMKEVGEAILKGWCILTSNSYNNEVLSLEASYLPNLEPNILECEVKWALESITMNKASGCDGIPVELFQILKDDAVKVLHSICQQIWKTQWWPQDWKSSVFIPIPKKCNPKECSNYCTLHSSHTLVK